MYELRAMELWIKVWLKEQRTERVIMNSNVLSWKELVSSEVLL